METNNLEVLSYEWNQQSDNIETTKKLKAMLSIRTEGNVIYLCHPRHLFDVLIENPETKMTQGVDWDSINVEKMIQYNDFGKYSIVEEICSKRNNQFTYLQKKATHMMKKYKEMGHSEWNYPVAILEEIDHGSNLPTYFARGIVNFSQERISLAFNPLAMKENPKESIWQKGLRFGDNFD